MINEEFLSDEKLDCAQWLNDKTASLEDFDKFEEFVTSVILSLERSFDDCTLSIRKDSKVTHAKLNSISYKVLEGSKDLNKCIAGLNNYEKAINEVSEKLNGLLEEVELIDLERNNVNNALTLISTFKQWASLIRELRSTLYRFPNHHEQIHGMFNTLQSVLVRLENEPGHNIRVDQLARFRDEWKTCLRPHLVELYQYSDLELIKEEICSLKDIGLYDFVIEVFTDCRKADFLTEHQFNFLTAKSLTDAGDHYLNTISDTIALWIEYCRIVFDSPLALMRQVNTLLSLRIESLCKIEKISDIDDVTSFKQRCDRFVSEMANICSLYNIPKSDEYNVGQCFLAMACLLNSVVVNRVQSYIDYETENIDNLDALLIRIPELDKDQTPVISKALGKFVSYYEQSSRRCKELTNDMLICQHIQLVQRFLLKFVKFIDDLVCRTSTPIEKPSNQTGSEQQFLNFRLAVNIMILVGKLIATIHDLEDVLELKLEEASRPPSADDGISLFAVKNAGRRLFVDLEEFNSDCERYKSIKNERGTYFPVVSRSLDDLSEALMQFAVDSLILPIEHRLSGYCQHEILGETNRSKSLVNGLPSYSIYPSQTVSEATKHILMLAQTIDQYLPDGRNMLLQVLLRTAAIRHRNGDNIHTYTDEDVGLIWIEQTCVSIVERLLTELCQLDLKSLHAGAYGQIITDLEHMQAILDNIGISSRCPLRVLLDCVHNGNSPTAAASLPTSLQKLCYGLRKVISSSVK